MDGMPGMIRKCYLALAIIVSTALPAWAVAGGYHPTRLIVRLESSASQSAINKISSAVIAAKFSPLFKVNSNALARSGFGESVYVAEFADSNTRADAEKFLASQPDVVYVERDVLMELFSDPLYTYQWGMQNDGQEYPGIIRVPGTGNDSLKMQSGVAGADVNRNAALERPTDRGRVRVAIIDTGVDYEHPDLAANVWHNVSEAGGRLGFDDDFNGYVDDLYGYDFSGDDATGFAISPDSDPMDTIGHGTHCAGIVGAVTGNGIGIEGVAPHVEIMCLKIFPNALASASAEAIVYAVENGAKVINASWGSPYFSTILTEAVKYAVDNGVLFVAAAGNSGSSTPFYPARLDEALTVGATNSKDEVTNFSTFGNWLDVCAPGQDILSLRAQNTDLYAEGGEPLLRIIENDYYLADGTSMAAPHVAGCAALILSVSPGLAVDSLRNLIINTTDRVADPNGVMPTSYSQYGGWGRVNVGRAAGVLQDEYAEIEEPHANAIVAGMVRFSGSAFSSTSQGFSLEVKPGSTEEWQTIGSGSAAIVRGQLIVWDSSPYDGETQLRLTVGEDVAYTTAIRLVNSTKVEILQPLENDTVFSAVDVIGSASLPQFSHYELAYYSDVEPKQKFLIKRSSELLFRKELAGWTVGQIVPGSGTLQLDVYSDTGMVTVKRRVFIKSALAEGYPRDPGLRPHYCSATGDIDGDGRNEIVTGSRNGIIVSEFVGNTSRLISMPWATSCESAPALHDFDGDGDDDIACVTDSGVAVIDSDGDFLPGWPKLVNTGNQYNAYPTPLVSDIDGDSLMEIMFINAAGEIYCWHADGSSYFRTQGGLFARTGTNGRPRTFGGSQVAFLFAYDFNEDGFQDIGTLYTAVRGQGGMFMYSGKDGSPLFPRLGDLVLSCDDMFGGVMADFDDDGEPEIAFAYWYSANLAMAVRIVEADGTDLPGWPKLFPEKIQFLTPFQAVGDLDNDSLPELVCVFSALDGGEVYVWNGDGTPFLASEFGRKDGFFAGTTSSLSNPLIVDVDDDGELEIISRGGALFLGKPERLLAWNLDASPVVGWPIYTYADPGDVTYATHTPVTGDFDNDGLIEMFMGSSDARLYMWNLPTPTTAEAIAWGSFMHDKRNTGSLAIVARPSPPAPPLPTSFRLAQNYPNPFNQATVIEFDLTNKSQVTIEVINVLGQTVTTITGTELEAGTHRVVWEGKDDRGNDLASGVYFYRLRMNNFTETRRMVMLK